MLGEQPGDPISYRKHLIEDIVPFWLRYAPDSRHGGLFTCLRDDGGMISTDKYLWSQCRAIWTFSALYNHVERSGEYLRVAESVADFVLKHGRDGAGRYYYRVSAEGHPLDGPVSIYTDFFAAYGLAELFRALPQEEYRQEAIRIIKQSVQRIREPGFNDLVPYFRPQGVGYIHGLSMILLETAGEVSLNVGNGEDFEECCEEAASAIMSRHVRGEQQILLEHLDGEGQPIDTPAGRAVNPGHAIESMWFVIHHALRRGKATLAARACEVIRWHLEKGWDDKFGGLFLALDSKGEKPWWPHAEKKIWWVHTEAIYALHLCEKLTGETWCGEWLERILRYCDEKFTNRAQGEWYQRLDREGRVITCTIALPVKDPFHLPRALIRSIQLLEGNRPFPSIGRRQGSCVLQRPI